jgi:hypothetical protein
MPYVKDVRRKVLGEQGLSTDLGDLAYIAYREAMELLTLDSGNPDYARRISIYGALAGVAQEFWDRHVRPYEDEAIKRNGDIP